MLCQAEPHNATQNAIKWVTSLHWQSALWCPGVRGLKPWQLPGQDWCWQQATTPEGRAPRCRTHQVPDTTQYDNMTPFHAPVQKERVRGERGPLPGALELESAQETEAPCRLHTTPCLYLQEGAPTTRARPCSQAGGQSCAGGHAEPQRVSRRNSGFGARGFCVQIPVLSPTSCVTLGTSLHHSEP